MPTRSWPKGQTQPLEKRKVGGSTPPLPPFLKASASPPICSNRRKKGSAMALSVPSQSKIATVRWLCSTMPVVLAVAVVRPGCTTSSEVQHVKGTGEWRREARSDGYLVARGQRALLAGELDSAVGDFGDAAGPARLPIAKIPARAAGWAVWATCCTAWAGGWNGSGDHAESVSVLTKAGRCVPQGGGAGDGAADS